MNVFISSIISGMEEFRDVAERSARTLGHDVIRAEAFSAQAQSPQIACLAGVRQADVVILIIGARYGAVQASGLSATHEEYREARERCPVLVMVQAGVDRESEQSAFLSEVQDWAEGHFTTNFSNTDQLRDAITGALHNLELAHATGPVDPDEILERATSLMPAGERGGGYSGEPHLALVIAGGPFQPVLRPVQLEEAEFVEHLQKLALFGEGAVLSPHQGTTVRIEDDSLILEQSDHAVSISETGAIRLNTKTRSPDCGLFVILQEDVREITGRFLGFANAVLNHIDPLVRLSHIVVAAKLIDTGHHAWRTRDEHARSPNSVTMNTSINGDPAPVHLSPPHRTRAALRLNAYDIADDLIARLRRQLQNPRRDL